MPHCQRYKKYGEEKSNKNKKKKHALHCLL